MKQSMKKTAILTIFGIFSMALVGSNKKLTIVTPPHNPSLPSSLLSYATVAESDQKQCVETNFQKKNSGTNTAPLQPIKTHCRARSFTFDVNPPETTHQPSPETVTASPKTIMEFPPATPPIIASSYSSLSSSSATSSHFPAQPFKGVTIEAKTETTSPTSNNSNDGSQSATSRSQTSVPAFSPVSQPLTPLAQRPIFLQPISPNSLPSSPQKQVSLRAQRPLRVVSEEMRPIGALLLLTPKKFTQLPPFQRSLARYMTKSQITLLIKAINIVCPLLGLYLLWGYFSSIRTTINQLIAEQQRSSKPSILGNEEADELS